jgi:hypothetical protein
MAVHDFVLPITKEETLREFVRYAFGVDIPNKQISEGHTTPWVAFRDAYFARSVVSVWKAARGFGGKSFLLALLGLTEAITLGVDVNVLGGSGEQSARVLAHMLQFWNMPNAPRYLLASEPAKRETKLTNGATIRALMASQASIRGLHVARLRLDEVDEIDLALLDAAMGQPMIQRGIAKQTVMSSTQQYADGTMAAIVKRAKEKGWAYHEWDYRASLKPHGWLDPAEVASKRLEVTEAMWLCEYENQEPSPESRAIQPEKAEQMFKRELGWYRGSPGEEIVIEPHDQQGIYATGADWARKQDWTIILTFRLDCNPARLVAFKRMGRTAWPTMVSEYNNRVKQYGQPAAHDGTGIGDVVSGYLTVEAEGVMMVGRTRSDMLTEYIAAIERGEIEAPYIEYMAGEHRYASTDDVYGSGHLPDTIAAGALAWYAATKPIVTHEVIYNRARIG